jgi:hypothetical protein
VLLLFLLNDFGAVVVVVEWDTEGINGKGMDEGRKRRGPSTDISPLFYEKSVWVIGLWREIYIYIYL